MTGHLYYWVADWNLSQAQASLLLGGPTGEMIDCTGGNVDKVIAAVRGHIHRYAAYITGTPDIRWTGEALADIPPDCAVWRIDQSDSDLMLLSDVKHAVKDDEPGASTNTIAVRVAKQRLARGDDYIIYTDRSNLAALEERVREAGMLPGRIIAFQFASPTSDPNLPVFPGGPTLRELNIDLSVVLVSHMPLPTVRRESNPSVNRIDYLVQALRAVISLLEGKVS